MNTLNVVSNGITPREVPRQAPRPTPPAHRTQEVGDGSSKRLLADGKELPEDFTHSGSSIGKCGNESAQAPERTQTTASREGCVAMQEGSDNLASLPSVNTLLLTLKHLDLQCQTVLELWDANQKNTLETYRGLRGKLDKAAQILRKAFSAAGKAPIPTTSSTPRPGALATDLLTQRASTGSHSVKPPLRIADELERGVFVFQAALQHALHAHQLYRFTEEIIGCAGLMRSEAPEHTAPLESLLHHKQLSIEYVKHAMNAMMEIGASNLVQQDALGQPSATPEEKSTYTDRLNKEGAHLATPQTASPTMFTVPKDLDVPEPEGGVLSIFELASQRRQQDPNGFRRSQVNIRAAEGTLHWYAATHQENVPRDSSGRPQRQLMADEFGARLSYLFEHRISRLPDIPATDSADDDPLTLLMQTYADILASIENQL